MKIGSRPWYSPPSVKTFKSLLNSLRRLIHVRKKNPLFGRGSLRFVPCANQHVVAYVREYQGQVALVVNNLSRLAQPAQLDLRAYRGMVPVEMVGKLPFPLIGEQPYFISLSPHSFFWFLLDRS